MSGSSIAPSSPSPATTQGDFSHAALSAAAVAMAADILVSSRENESRRQHRHGGKLARLARDPVGMALALALADRIFRPRSADRQAAQFRTAVREYGVPKFLPPLQRLLLSSAARYATAFPSAIMPAIAEKIRKASGKFILPAAPERLHAHLAARKKTGLTADIILIGDAITGDATATAHLDQLVALLNDPAVTRLTVLVHQLCPRRDPLAFNENSATIRDRLRRLFRAAMANPLPGSAGQHQPKFITLGLDDPRDALLAAASFRLTLGEAEFLRLEAGIVIPACLPDSLAIQKDLTTWAMDRAAAGGSPITIRLVKGGNRAACLTDAALRGWPPAIFPDKLETDANFKRMLHFALEKPDRHAAARIAIATHNLFDIAYAITLRDHQHAAGHVEFEMLEGVASHLVPAVKRAAGSLRLHTPIARRQDLIPCSGCLARRILDATTDGGFLRDLPGLEPGTPQWESQKHHFLRACDARANPPAHPRPATDRSTPDGREPITKPDAPFQNEPDTDWSLPANMTWLQECLLAAREAPPEQIPLVVAGLSPDQDYPAIGTDPSRPHATAYTHALADDPTVEQAVAAARAALASWSAMPAKNRSAILREAAAVIARHRGASIAALVLDIAKSIPDADAEVSLAVDMANHHARAFDDTAALADLQADPLGVVVVAPAWNTPYGLPAGAITAALMAGNTVIFKPAPEAVLCSWRLANHLWEAGVPRDVLQFLPAPENYVGRRLVAHPAVSAVLLTGSHQTARSFLGMASHIRLLAATSAKNTLVITAAADLDQAVADLVDSAFIHSGQHPAAASLAIVEAAVYDNPVFREKLRDAAASLKAAAAWTPGAAITPLIRPPSQELHRAQLTLDPGEDWLLQPKRLGQNPNLWSAGIKLGIQPGSWFHLNECPGPLLGIMRADNLDHAIRLQNDTPFGLTGGIHSLDPAEVYRWLTTAEIGNACVNRPLAGPAARRHPFGGWKFSAFGPIRKIGGPNFTASLARWQQLDLPAHSAPLRPDIADILQTIKRWLKVDLEKQVAEAAARSYQHFMDTEFGVEHDPSALPGQANIFRYLPLPRGILLRLRDPFEPLHLAGAVLAALTTKVSIELSLQRPSSFADALGLPSTIESDANFALRLEKDATRYDLLRAPMGTTSDVLQAATRHHLAVVDQPILANGRIELLHYFREQSISATTHRHGHPRPTAPAPRP